MTDAPPTASIPSNARARQLRACLLCSIIQSPVDFRRNGCPNCEEIMQMKQSQDRVLACTTTHFEGVIAAIDSEASWVARWQRTSKYVRGMYAVRVKGRIPDDVDQELQERGIRYRPRDQTDQD
ncbi:transcription elongation factor SPT4 [Fomitiporia mediterranea MF3/22]|uniref:transcription elongation factor SPT4 n=1 Tax=Fomitiporia mediterranea (strain MF3/22) TaxID=694068 RepID=UPI0004408E8A|nr:transcription elongation factor SPT4 [Fomitiporia mediterranea MF3/22]EJD00818.1 transcription elongation factor SPT4 [Fomitiporia mediterranea MF3/22]